MPLNILVTGASIAGCTLSWWLARWGHGVTLVERTEVFRLNGQNIDVRGAGREVVRRMGLLEAVRAHGTGEEGILFVDEENETKAEIDAALFGGEGPTAELEILRGDLARLLFDAGKDKYETVFGDRIESLADTAEGVEVRFAHGGTRRFDLVVAAEGIGSSTRRLVFGEEAERVPLGLSMGYFTIPRAATDSSMARWFNAPGGRSVFLRPDNHGTTRIVLTVRQPPGGERKLPPDEQKAFLRERFADAGWEVPRILEGLDAAEDFYFEEIGQIKAERWHKGRVVLTGDAAWCASPISGMGTTLALVGAYVLAGELSKASDPAEALEAYERIMRPLVDKAQDVPKVGTRVAQPTTRLGIGLQHLAINVLTSAPVAAVGKRFIAPPSDAIELPAYGEGTHASGG